MSKGKNTAATTANGTWNRAEKFNALTSGNARFLKTSALEDGQSITGTVKALTSSDKYPDAPVLVIEDLNGAEKQVNLSGTARKAAKTGFFKPGLTYEIRKEGTEMIKGRPSGVFGIYLLSKDSTSNAASGSAANDDI